MATLDQIYAKVEQLRDELAVVVASAKLNPKQITIIQGLSEINASLGVMRAGEFLALSDGEDPQDADGTGTFISALGRTFASKLYHIGGVFNGDLKWGANAITGELEAGDGAVNLTANGLSLYDGATEIGRFGNLNGFLTYTTDTYGMAMGDSNQYMTYDQTNGLKIYGALVSDREILTADRTYYVATTGDDGNDGLAVGTPFLTIQHAIDIASTLIDARNYTVTIQVADGTYNSAAINLKEVLGAKSVILQGNVTTPDNVIVNRSVSAGNYGMFNIEGIQSIYHIQGFLISSSYNGFGIYVTLGSVVYFKFINFSTGLVIHLRANDGATIIVEDSYEISGDTGAHIMLQGNSRITAWASIAVTLTDTPAFSNWFLNCTGMSIYDISSGIISYNGAATGVRYYGGSMSLINTSGDTLPGDAAGSVATGAVYT